MRAWPGNSLSGRLLFLTCLFVLISEMLIFAPSVGRQYHVLVADRVRAAESAVLPFTMIKWANLPTDLRSTMLGRLGADSVALVWPDRREFFPGILLPRHIDKRVDLADSSALKEIGNGLDCLFLGGNRTLYLLSPTLIHDATRIEVAVSEAPLRQALIDYALRTAGIALIVTLLTALPLWWCFDRLLVGPMRRIIQAMAVFRENPEDARRIFQPSGKKDEIGQAMRELAAMQRDVQHSLHQKARLAALGGAVARIQHDLRNMLASAQLISDRLTASADPMVRKSAPNLIATIDRACRLAGTTLKYAQSEQPPFSASRFALSELIAEAAEAAHLDGAVLRNLVPAGLSIEADREHLFRAVHNLIGNARDALLARADDAITVAAWREEGRVIIEVADTGSGLPSAIQDKLFLPFAPSAKGGAGLGLAIASELVRGHGGSLCLIATGSDGTRFRITLPDGAKGWTGAV